MSDTRAAAWKQIAMPITHALFGPEDAHKISIWMAKWGLVPRERVDPDQKDRLLETEVWGKKIQNPVGMAAGFDKNGEAIDALLHFGFGFVEVGSVTPQPQPGNPTPRFFRLPQDMAVINRYGFNSEGHQTVIDRLRTRIRKYLHTNRLILSIENKQPNDIAELESYGFSLPEGIPRSLVSDKLLGLNLGKNKVSLPESNSDYVDGVLKLGPFADYIVVNVSSPNTPGLRALQRREPMLKLMKEVKEARDKNLPHHPPLLVKIAPDVSYDELEDIAAVIQTAGIDGVIISNTTISRPETLKGDIKTRREFGGLSGAPLKPLSLSTVRSFYALTNGKVPIIGCGGIYTADDAIDFAKAGASLVQLYTSMGYHGPGIVDEIKEGLVSRLSKEGKKWKELVGEDHRKK
ncbi:Dihydroorotate dehydrogenase (quinone), mitochondrial [Blyttiomyces sp. JEL0837]|nr:Dihydroorotate dehydrogenase (quinone), mitochondrial [Blyttiomyces sp. JEL0837]